MKSNGIARDRVVVSTGGGVAETSRELRKDLGRTETQLDETKTKHRVFYVFLGPVNGTLGRWHALSMKVLSTVGDSCSNLKSNVS
jgi:hypothetical protein